MARPQKIDPQEVIKGFRDDTFKYGSEAARHFKCSRVRIMQILKEHAPDLLPGKVKPRSGAEQKTITARQKKMKAATEKALKDNPTHVAAATSLGLTTSGLYSRMSRLGIDIPA